MRRPAACNQCSHCVGHARGSPVLCCVALNPPPPPPPPGHRWESYWCSQSAAAGTILSAALLSHPSDQISRSCSEGEPPPSPVYQPLALLLFIPPLSLAMPIAPRILGEAKVSVKCMAVNNCKQSIYSCTFQTASLSLISSHYCYRQPLFHQINIITFEFA